MKRLGQKQCVLALLTLSLGACPRGAQELARVAGDTGAQDLAKTQEGPDGRDEDGRDSSGDPCPWTVEVLGDSIPLVADDYRDFRLAFNAQKREFAVVYAVADLPRIFFRRFSDAGVPLSAPIEIQPELAPLPQEARWVRNLLGVVLIENAWVVLWSQVGALKDSAGEHALESHIYAQHVEGEVLVGDPQALVSIPTYLRAEDFQWTGDQLVIVSVDSLTNDPQPSLGDNPVVRLRRFNADLVSFGAVITLPTLLPSTLRRVGQVRVRGDDERMGLLYVAWYEDHETTEVVFAL
ncbi:MAG: hypothetical protein JRH20_17500, partial [Deltaproteobacteria bacterium]|nr:hypothetical protein [Deltaproteobacteria bacterium]